MCWSWSVLSGGSHPHDDFIDRPSTCSALHCPALSVITSIRVLTQLVNISIITDPIMIMIHWHMIPSHSLTPTTTLLFNKVTHCRQLSCVCNRLVISNIIYCWLLTDSITFPASFRLILTYTIFTRVNALSCCCCNTKCYYTNNSYTYLRKKVYTYIFKTMNLVSFIANDPRIESDMFNV